MLHLRATRNTSRRRTGLALMAIAALPLVLASTGCATAPKEPPLTLEQRQLNLDSFEYAWATVN